MTQVFNTQDSKNPSPGKVQGQLEKLREDLLTKRQNSVASGLVSDIQMIDAALGQVETALDKVKLDQKITNSQVRLGQVRSGSTSQEAELEPDSRVISEREAQQIQAIRSVQGQSIASGEVFASMHGKEPSNISYMKKNISGLFDLVALKG